jgi:hypothetical protein
MALVQGLEPGRRPAAPLDPVTAILEAFQSHQTLDFERTLTCPCRAPGYL